MPQTLASTRIAERYTAEFPLSRKLHDQARGIFPNGVTHDGRFMLPFPVYVDRARGSRKWTVEGKELVDYWSGHGALLLGHCHPAVVEAVQQQMARATHPGACHEREIEWGQWVQKLIPSAERLRFVSSGTEATLMALRLARIHTGKNRVLKFAGHFHGWHDFVIPGAFPPCDSSPVPGVTDEVQSDTVIIPPNDLAAVEAAFQKDPEIACVILEPTGGHWGTVPIGGDFLKGLRELTARYDKLLIFDEVISGFRVSPGGAQAHFGVTPDMTTLAKVLAGGLPGGCVAGRADILGHIEFRKDNRNKMRHPGTFNANPLSAAAGSATLEIVAQGQACATANETARTIRRRLNDLFAEHGVNWIAYGTFSGYRILTNYEGPRPTEDDFVPHGGSVEKLESPPSPELVFAYRQAMLLHGVDSWGLGGMLSAAHTAEDVDRTVAAVAGSLEMLQAEGLL